MNTFLKYTLWSLGGLSVIVFIAALIAPQVLFYQRLSQYGWSTDPARWGQYGDFIGGITNPILSAISIVVLVYLTITVHNNEKKRHDDAIKSEEARSKEITELEEHRNLANIEAQRQIALNQFRYDTFNDLKAHLRSVNDFYPTFNEMHANYLLLSKYLVQFHEDNGYLFKNRKYILGWNAFTGACLLLTVQIGRLQRVDDDTEADMQDPKMIYTLASDAEFEEYRTACNDFFERRATQIAIIQKIIVGDYIEDL